MTVVTDGQLAGLLAGAKPATDVPLPRLARESDDAAPAGVAEAMSVIAAPSRMLVWTVNARDALGFHPAYLAARDGRFAALLHGEDGWRVASFDAAPAAIGSLGTLGLPGEGARASAAGSPLSLDLAGIAALLAAADVHHEAALRAELDRRHLPPPELSSRALERALAHGLSTGDTRWAVCAARWTAPVSLAGARGKMKQGLQALEGAGNGGGAGAALEVARRLAGVRAGVGVTALAWEDGRRRVLAHATALGNERGLWWAEWEGVPVAPHAKLREVEGKDLPAAASKWLTG